MRRPRITGILTALVACTDPASRSELGVRVFLDPPGREFSGLQISITGPGVQRLYARADFQPASGSQSQWSAPTLELRHTGSLTADVSYDALGASPPVPASVTFDVVGGWNYGVSVHLGGARPVGIFCGTVAAAVALSADATDSMFIVRGGSPKGAVC